MNIDDLKNMSVKQLRSLLKELSVQSMGVKDVAFKHAIEDEISRRTR